MDNVPTRTKYASVIMSAVLIFGAVSAAFIALPQNAYAVVTITASADTFYGPGFVRVLVTDTALDESGDTILPTIEVRDGNTVLADEQIEVEAIGSSGQFEFFITTSDVPLVPNSPTKTTVVDLAANGWVTGPFIARIHGAAADEFVSDLAEDSVNVNGGDPSHGSNNYGIATTLEGGEEIRILYGGQTFIIDFDDTGAVISSDRSEAGADNVIVLSLADQDANTDSTIVDVFTFLEADVGFEPTTLLSSTNAIDYDDAVAGATWTETGQNTGVFELEVVVEGDATALENELDVTLPTGNTFTLTDHSVYEDLDDTTGLPVTTSVDFEEITPETDTSSVSVTLRNRDGAVALDDPPTFANGFTPSITDADRNIRMDDGDDIAGGEVEICVGLVCDFFDFTETDDESGMFVPDYADDRIDILFGLAVDVDGTTGIITLDLDAIQDEDEIVLAYTDPAFSSNSVFELREELATTAGTLSLSQAEAGIHDIITLTLNDADLNTDSETVETYVVNAGTGGSFEIDGIPVASLDILAADEDVVIGIFEATFIETGPNTGVFEADDVDMGDINDDIGGDLDDGDEVEFTYNDEMEDPVEDDDATITIGSPDAGIDSDRSTVPVPTDGDPVVVTLTVVDPNQNDNPGSVDTVIVDFGAGNIEVRDGDGAEFNSDDDPADIFDLTGLTDDITLTETGANTGIFEEEVELEPDIADIDRLRNARVTFTYEELDGDTDSTSVTYRSYDGILTANPQVVGPGSETIIRVNDQDANKDPNEEETVLVAFETSDDTDEGTACIGGIGACLSLDETGPDTGIFEETVEIGADIDIGDIDEEEFSDEIELTYVDAITSSGDVDEDRELTIRVATSTGTLTRVPEIVGPGTEITVQLADTDLNVNPNGRDSIDPDIVDTIEIDSSDGDSGDLGAEETGPNTGVFEFTIQFFPRDVDEDGELDQISDDEFEYGVLPGDIIAIQYTDERDALGNKVQVTMVFEITSADPEMEADEPTVQPGDSILLTVTDHDANRDGDAEDSIDIDITSDQDPIGFTLAALETGDNTGVFTVSIPTSTTVSSGSIAVRTGSSVYLEYEDEFPADYAERKDQVLDPSKDFTLVVPVGTPTGNINATTPTPPVLTDISGSSISEVTVGQQVILNVSVKNNNNAPQPFAAIVEVRDADGFTVMLQWQTGVLNPDDTIDVGLSFVPTDAGTYTARTFVLSSVQNPTVLSPVAESTFTVS